VLPFTNFQMNSEQNTKYDSLYLTVAQTAGSVDNILDSFFSFLARKTDFFHHPDLARQKVNQALDRCTPPVARPKIEELPDQIPAKASSASSTTPVPAPAPAAAAGSSDTVVPTLNGGVTERYRWTQTLGSVDMFVTLGSGVRARDLVVEVGTDSLRVALKSGGTLVEGKLHSKVKDSTWTVDGGILQINLEKQDGMKWWTCVMVGDTEIDTQKIVPENSKLSDLDGETRAMVEKMMFDQSQKARGLPTSDQLKQHEILDKFKKAHPEMDFSKAKINFGSSPGEFSSLQQ
jgi:hypothetical protein